MAMPKTPDGDSEFRPSLKCRFICHPLFTKKHTHTGMQPFLVHISLTNLTVLTDCRKFWLYVGSLSLVS